jgi:CRISPR-associated protein Cas2
MLVIVAYDVTDDRRRSEIASELKNYGQRVQRSVFECHLDREQVAELQRVIGKLIDMEKDSVRYYYLCKRDVRNVDCFGIAVRYRDEDYFMV